jgi:hypothetical protein
MFEKFDTLDESILPCCFARVLLRKLLATRVAMLDSQAAPTNLND